MDQQEVHPKVYCCLRIDGSALCSLQFQQVLYLTTDSLRYPMISALCSFQYHLELHPLSCSAISIALEAC
ncbi:hypothetical protein Patl1_03786 [Pistacia atlantica]|uniref:Uncharacterized protein n=1 Tax=Pistacia atlantica TaxID=434234 RepID=A0ACC1BQE7_9ROSI|nr:hypothetical protein Patl1_03786 [Pistacia atlantica]